MSATGMRGSALPGREAARSARREAGAFEPFGPSPASRRGNGLLLALIAAAALALRLGVAALDGPHPPVSDGHDFDRIAHALGAGRGYGDLPSFKTSHRAPLQPFWLALVYAVAGDGATSRAAAAAVLGAGLVLAVGLLARELGGSQAALFGAAIAAVYPRFIDYSTRLWSLSEGLFATLFTAALLAWCRAERGSRTAGALAGALFGLAALARPVALFFPLVLLLRMGSVRRSSIVLAIATFAAVLAPWTWRNYVVFGRFVPVSTMGGIVLYQGFHPPRDGWGYTPWDEIHALTAGATSEPEVSDILVRRTLADIAAHPRQALSLLPRKAAWLLQPFSERSGRLDVVFVIILLLGLLGAWRLRRERRFRVLLLSLLYVAAMSLVFYGSPRFRFPAEPVLVALAAATFSRLASERAGQRRLALLLAAAAALGIVPGLDRETVAQRLRRSGLPLGATPSGPAPGEEMP